MPASRKQIPLRLPPDLVERVDAWAATAETGLSRNKAIAALIERAMFSLHAALANFIDKRTSQ